MVSTIEQMQVQIGQDQVSGGVSVLCWLAASVAMFKCYSKLYPRSYMSVVHRLLNERSPGKSIAYFYDKLPENEAVWTKQVHLYLKNEGNVKYYGIIFHIL